MHGDPVDCVAGAGGRCKEDITALLRHVVVQVLPEITHTISRLPPISLKTCLREMGDCVVGLVGAEILVADLSDVRSVCTDPDRELPARCRGK